MKKIVVISGAGSGIGRAIAKVLAEENYQLILLGRNLSKLQETQSQLTHSESHPCYSCDIRNKQDIRNALANSGFNSIYGVIANAGIAGENNYCTEDRWGDIIDTNLTGTYNTIQECLPYLKKDAAEYKQVVILSSILARLGVPGYSAYCASKAGLLGLMRSFAAEFSGDKILVNALCPGWVNTEMAHRGLEDFSKALNISKEEAYQQAMAQVPLGKMSEPNEIAHQIAFLISDKQTSLTGQTLDINNGAMMP
jgi:NAD(P)-dependent dehydrogenase (short-subunit alcohol dehydrogenase family)